MPRPGPRPYECVRRAWHSDRHQPIRGSIIQQIFRVVHEKHSTATKKKKEWQEKLPIVVLKSEEIMYSKANSEADYMDLETLWDRVNDAINTLIRIDESMETGELLPPCVEAALNLGCVAIRASRSQQHSNPQSYLSPRTEGPGFGMKNERTPTIGNQLALARPTTTNSTHLMSGSYRNVMHNNNSPTSPRKFPLSADAFPPPGYNQFVQLESNTSWNVGSVYPLYYGTQFQPQVPRTGSHTAEILDTIIVGTPIFPPNAKPAGMGCSRNLFSYEGDADATNRVTQADTRDNHEKTTEMGCDLSLRLGAYLDSWTSKGKRSAREIDDVGPSSSQEEGKFRNLASPRNKEFSFFPVETTNFPFEFHTS